MMQKLMADSFQSDAWVATNLARCAAIIEFCDSPTPDNRKAMHDACEPVQKDMDLAV